MTSPISKSIVKFGHLLNTHKIHIPQRTLTKYISIKRHLQNIYPSKDTHKIYIPQRTLTKYISLKGHSQKGHMTHIGYQHITQRMLREWSQDAHRTLKECSENCHKRLTENSKNAQRIVTRCSQNTKKCSENGHRTLK